LTSSRLIALAIVEINVFTLGINLLFSLESSSSAVGRAIWFTTKMFTSFLRSIFLMGWLVDKIKRSFKVTFLLWYHSLKNDCRFLWEVVVFFGRAPWCVLRKCFKSFWRSIFLMGCLIDKVKRFLKVTAFHYGTLPLRTNVRLS
jgi:hypothetical protein